MYRHSVCSTLLAIVAALAILSVVSDADAYNLVDDDEVKLDLSLLGEAGYEVSKPVGDDELDYGPRLSLARIKGAATFKDYGSVTIQTGVDGSDVVLLDAVVSLTAAKPFALKLGQFKSPVSHEYLIGGADLLFLSRAALRQFVPGRRIGTQAEYAIEAGDNLTITPQVGIFAAPDGTVTEPLGNSIVGRILVEPGEHVDIHLAGAEFVFDENTKATIGDPGLAYDQIVDAAVSYNTDRWNLHGEGVYLTDPAEFIDYAAAGYVHGAYRLGELDGISYEPALGYDIFGTSAQAPRHRATAGLNLYINGERLIASADYRLTLFPDDTGHTGVLQLQGSI